MKIVKYFACITLMVFVSCSDLTNLKVPKKISLKSEAKYEISLGKAALTVRDHLNAVELREIINNEDIKIYDYKSSNDPHNTQKFLLNYSAVDVPLDFSKYIEDININEDFAESLNQKFNIQGNHIFEKSIDLPDFNKLIVESFESSPVTLVLMEPGAGNSFSTSDGTWDNQDINFTIETPSFDSVQLKNGFALIKFIPDVGNMPSSTFSMSVKVSLISDNKEIAQSDYTEIGNSGGVILIDLSQKELIPKLKLRIEGNLKDGSASHIAKYNISFGLSDTAKIASIKGLNMTTEDLEKESPGAGKISINETIDASSLTSFLINATVDKGNISVKQFVPSTWNGIVCDSNFSFEGGVQVSNSEFVSGNLEESNNQNCILNKYADISQKQITSENINLQGELNLAFKNASFEFNDDDPTSLSLLGEFNIESLSNAQVNIEKLIDPSTLNKSINKELNEEMVKYIHSISFNKVGIICGFDSNIPENDITIQASVTSSSLDITTPLQDEYVLSNADEKLEVVTDESWKKTVYLGNESSEQIEELDFTLNVDLKGNNAAHPEYITFASLKTNTDYEIKSNIDVIFDWSEITINADNTSVDGEIDVSLNLKEILAEYLEGDEQDIVDKIRLKGIEGYVFISRPEFSSNDKITEDPLASLNNFQGSIKTVYGSTTEYLIGSESNKETLKFAPTNIDFDALANNETYTIETELFDSEKPYYSGKINGDVLVNMVNSQVEDSKLVYDLTLASDNSGQITLTKDAVDSLSGINSESTPSIQVIISLLVPINIEITDDIIIEDVLSMAGIEIEEDLLNRDGIEDSSDIKEFTDVIKKIYCKYSISNSTGLNFTSSIYDLVSGVEYDLTFDGNTQIFNFSTQDVNKILDSYPFMPKIKLEISKGEVLLKRDAIFGAEAIIGIETDGTYELYGDEE